jgi:hypothetical protein
MTGTTRTEDSSGPSQPGGQSALQTSPYTLQNKPAGSLPPALKQIVLEMDNKILPADGITKVEIRITLWDAERKPYQKHQQVTLSVDSAYGCLQNPKDEETRLETKLPLEITDGIGRAFFRTPRFPERIKLNAKAIIPSLSGATAPYDVIAESITIDVVRS